MRFHPALAVTILCVVGPRAGATTWDLQKQWSNTANPHGPWTLVQAGAPLPRDKDWTAISGVDAAYNPSSGHIRQPAFAPGNTVGHYLPAWFKATVTPADPVFGWRQGDILVHTTDAFNGIGSGVAAVVFAAPRAGAATISGTLYNARNIHRPQAWFLTVDGVTMATGSLPGDGTFPRDHKQAFKLTAVPLSAGSTVVITVQEDAGPSGPGDFVGVALKVTIP